jgi:hypothetical protein
MNLTEKLLSQYKVRRDEMPTPSTLDESAHWSYRQAAAVLHCFQPNALQPLDSSYANQSALKLLADDTAPAPGGVAEGLVTLKLSIRQEALRQLRTRETMRNALRANPDRPQTPQQALWETYLTSGILPDPKILSYHDLTTFAPLIDWLNGLDLALPSPTEIQALLREKSILASFDHLVTTNFTGRKRELGIIRAYIETLPTDNFTGSQVLAIYGPGGVGKSALVGRVLWELNQDDSSRRIPFAYLAFDQPTLRIESPYTILVEAAAHLAIQFPQHQAAFDSFSQQVTRFREEQSKLGNRKQSTTRDNRVQVANGLENDLYKKFINLLYAITSTQTTFTPFVLVLDTFEEVQYRDRESLQSFWRMIYILQFPIPVMRIIICGRAAIDETDLLPSIAKLSLIDLELADRVLMLHRLGVTNETLATTIANQIGGNPLTLRLAANVLAKAPEDVTDAGITGITNRLRFAIDEQLIQGQLYRRILDHIHDPDVRKLAHPGMVLRRVTPEIILYVLGPVCKPKVKDSAKAHELFEELRREHGLVQAGDPGTLVYRPEIRQAMVRLLRQDRPTEVAELHRHAVRYYQTRTLWNDRAEELYHRLMQNQEGWELESRWQSSPDIQQSLAANLDDYSDEMKVWLSSRMSLELPRSVFFNADAALWERNVTRKVQQALSQRLYDAALDLLNERQDRSSDSPLFALEAKANLLQKKPIEAKKLLETGIERVAEGGNRGRMAELLWLKSQVAVLQGNLNEADESLAQAQQAVERASTQMPLMHILGQRLLLRAYYTPMFPTESVGPLRIQLGEVCLAFDEPIPSKAYFVAHLASLMLDNEFPRAEANLARFVPGNPSTDWPGAVPTMALTDENLQGLEPFRNDWENDNDYNLERGFLI